MRNLDNSIIPVDAVFGKAVFFQQLFLKIKEFLFTDDLPIQHNPGNSHAAYRSGTAGTSHILYLISVSCASPIISASGTLFPIRLSFDSQ